MAIEIEITSLEPELTQLIEKVLVKTLKYLYEDNLSVSVLITDDLEMQSLNKQYRNIDKATDVLSFAMRDGDDFPTGEKENLGDIVISLEYAKRQALELEHSIEDEITRLLVHGCLHLLGYEHENVSEQEAQKMFAKEQEIIDSL